MALRLLALVALLLSSNSYAKSLADLRASLTRLEDMIAHNYASDHRQVQKWLKNREGKMPSAPDKLLKSYYFLGTVNSQIWINYPTGNEQQDGLRYRRAKSFLEVAAMYEYEIDKVENRLDKLEQIRQTRIKLEKHHYWRATAQFMSYQESATLNDGIGKENIFSTQRGTCFGGQWGYGNIYQEWTADACFFNTQGNVGTENTTRYYQRGITTHGIMLKPAYWKLLSDNAAGIGLGMPILLRQTKYTEPGGTSVKPRLAVPFGLSIEGRWSLSPRWKVNSTAGFIDSSLLWSFGVLYDL